ncbi:E3 ubiquitin-protein ligase ZNRF1-like isoform X2 [Sycon ciliatum]|uniref:E3 ubiquitin-protein ligase ZNRF1-like isoform X2 n=1 Tax=Sycon ciliatum TaxID=27933 RepID=UPI0020AC098E|eukprot:scpid89874/ scgid26624/ E3 ubiquitin-protein ligase znrf1; Zinc/RING finger protein 1
MGARVSSTEDERPNSSSRHRCGSADGPSTRPSPSGSLSMRRHHSRRLTSDNGPHPPLSLPLSSQLEENYPIGVKCPSCSKQVKVENIEDHLMECLSKPRVSYNADTLTVAAGECIICFEDMEVGNVIARLPCLCQFHKTCIDKWFDVHRCCPSHPDMATS